MFEKMYNEFKTKKKYIKPHIFKNFGIFFIPVFAQENIIENIIVDNRLMKSRHRSHQSSDVVILESPAGSRHDEIKYYVRFDRYWFFVFYIEVRYYQMFNRVELRKLDKFWNVLACIWACTLTVRVYFNTVAITRLESRRLYSFWNWQYLKSKIRVNTSPLGGSLMIYH